MVLPTSGAGREPVQVEAACAPCCRGADTAASAKNSVPRGADFAPTSESCTGRGAENDVLSLLEPNTNDIKYTSPSERRTEENPRESEG